MNRFSGTTLYLLPIKNLGELDLGEKEGLIETLESTPLNQTHEIHSHCVVESTHLMPHTITPLSDDIK